MIYDTTIGIHRHKGDPEPTEKRCLRCGEVRPISEYYKRASSKYYRPYCNKCHSKTSNTNLRERVRDRKRKAVEMFGGRCADCGGVFPPCAFDFHHIDENGGKNPVPKTYLNTRSWEVVLEELNKCVMLCANCHRIRHHGDK